MKRLSIFVYALLVVLVVCIPGCKKRLSPNDALTLARVRETMVPFIYAQSMSNWQFPESYEDMLSKGMDTPINPYTDKPMIDTGTSDFNPQVSPGNFHYVPIRDKAGQIGNFSIFVFGEKGLLRHIRPSPLAAG